MPPYIPNCDLPNFRQSVPSGDGWTICANEDPRRSSAVTWENKATGETIVVPSIWYNMPAARYADGLRWNAERSDESAARKDSDDKPWSASEAAYMRRQARRLRAMAILCDRNPDLPAGKIDFRGLSDPTTSREVEDATVSAIEAGS